MEKYDAWQNVKTKSGLNADEVISALQKYIRRSEEDKAVAVAWEMYITSEQLENYLWQRLQVISVEDIGFGDVSAPVLIRNLNQMRREYSYTAPDRPLFFVHAIRYLSRCEKDRSSDLLKNIVERESKAGKWPELDDYVFDMHTRKGQKLGRDIKYFLAEASKVIPEKPGAHEKYLARLTALLQKED